MKYPRILLMAGLVALFAFPPSVHALSVNKLVVIKMSGDRGWSVDCTFQREGDDPIEKSARGRGRVVTFAVEKVTGGSCDYVGPSRRGELKISFTDENRPSYCPLAQEAGLCVTRAGVGETGSFDF
ncbi:MAG: hypothetical protein AAFR21_07365 [Pseudomonadota bacterium]